MTPEQFTARLPELSCNPLPSKPPFVFNGLSSRVFPLRASLDALQRFCNGTLNIVPESVGRFRATLPFVYLSLLDYGQVAEGSGIGWFAQVEVFFAVPVAWYRKRGGRWEFHDWATVTPFIYVDDDFSVPLGRGAYGYPKVLGRVVPAASRWIHDVGAPRTLARVETDVFPAAYAGRQLERRVFLEVEQATLPASLGLPVAADAPSRPWTMASRLAQALAGLGRDAQWLAQAPRIAPAPGMDDPGTLAGMLARLAPGLVPGGPGMVTHALNLKQFRRSDAVQDICYQALTDGPMRIDALVGGGLLGEDRVLLGDASGGHTIRLHDYPTLPIVRQLGLEVRRSWQDGDAGVAVHELEPVLPFWMQADVNLLASANLAWRGQDGGWRDGAGQPLADGQPGAASNAEPAGAPPTAPRFNTQVASAVEAITGPFEFSGATLRVLPLLARRAALQQHLDRWINQPLSDPVLDADGRPQRVRLRVWSRPPAHVNRGAPIGGELACVYLVAACFEHVTSRSNNIGDWTRDELSFLVPVCWERATDPDADDGDDAAWASMGVGVVPAYCFVDQCMAAISRQEVQGIDARVASFIRPAQNWLSPQADADHPRQPLLRLEAEAWSAIDVGQQASRQPLLEIVRHEVNAGLGDGAAPDTAAAWAEALRLDLGTKKGTQASHPVRCKTARALALELLGNQVPMAMYSLKQFRDVVDPDKACYQALVRVPRAITELQDLCEIEETLVVRIHDYPKLDIVQTLGLLGVQLPAPGGGVLHQVQALRPFTLRGRLAEPLAERLASRTGTRVWTLSPEAFQGRLGERPGTDPHGGSAFGSRAQASPGRPQVRPRAETMQDRSDPARIARLMFHAREEMGEPPVSVAEARAALAVVDPQMVIDAVLSREWGRSDADARWRRGRQWIDEALAALPADPAAAQAAESVLLAQVLAQWQRRLGFPGALADALPPLSAGLAQASAALQAVERAHHRVVPLLEPAATLDGPQAVAARQAVRALLQALAAAAQVAMPAVLGGVDRLDHQASGWRLRLGELLNTPPLSELAAPGRRRVAAAVTATRLHDAAPALREAVVLARRWCRAVHAAVCDALSRAWQKPDFCIRRDAVGDQRDQLLTLTGAWDADWYWGKRFDDVPLLDTAPDGPGTR